MALSGFINLLKPPGMSSHDAVNCVRRALGLKKAGHAGTLDPGAASFVSGRRRTVGTTWARLSRRAARPCRTRRLSPVRCRN